MLTNNLVIEAKAFEKSLENPIKYNLRHVHVRDFDEDAAESFDKTLVSIANDGQKIIPVIVDSYGGAVYSLLRMLDTVKRLQDKGVIIPTIGKGKCMSCGSVMLAAGTPGHRYLSPNSTIMVHEVSTMIWYDKNTEIQASAEETERLNTLLMIKLAEFSKKPKNYFVKLIHKAGHADIFIPAKEAKILGLIDKIGEPEFKTVLKMDVYIDNKLV